MINMPISYRLAKWHNKHSGGFAIHWAGHMEDPFVVTGESEDDGRKTRYVIQSFEPYKHGGTSQARKAAEDLLSELNDPLGHIAKIRAREYEPMGLNQDPSLSKFGRDCYANGFMAGFRYAQEEAESV